MPEISNADSDLVLGGIEPGGCIPSMGRVYGPPLARPTQTTEEAREKIEALLYNYEQDLLQKKTAIKADEGKPPLSLLSRTALEEISKVMAFGRDKYAADNWRKGFMWRRTLDAALRHLTAFMDGEDKDPESGLSHMAHLGCNVMFLLEFEKTHPEMDDRYKHVSS